MSPAGEKEKKDILQYVINLLKMKSCPPKENHKTVPIQPYRQLIPTALELPINKQHSLPNSIRVLDPFFLLGNQTRYVCCQRIRSTSQWLHKRTL